MQTSTSVCIDLVSAKVQDPASLPRAFLPSFLDLTGHKSQAQLLSTDIRHWPTSRRDETCQGSLFILRSCPEVGSSGSTNAWHFQLHSWTCVDNSVGSCSRVSCHEGASLGAITCEQPLGPANPYNRPEGFLYQKGRRPLGFHSAWEKDARKSLSESLQASDDCRGWGRCQGHLGQKPHLSLWHSPRRSWSSPSKFQDWEADLTTTKKKVSGTTAINRTLMFSGIFDTPSFFFNGVYWMSLWSDDCRTWKTCCYWYLTTGLIIGLFTHLHTHTNTQIYII